MRGKHRGYLISIYEQATYYGRPVRARQGTSAAIPHIRCVIGDQMIPNPTSFNGAYFSRRYGSSRQTYKKESQRLLTLPFLVFAMVMTPSGNAQG